LKVFGCTRIHECTVHLVGPDQVDNEISPTDEGDVEMRKWTCILGLVLAFAALGVAPSGASAIINYRICGGPAPIHSSYSASSPTIGTLQNGEVFTGHQNSYENFDYGYAYGSAHVWGYVNRHFYC
jgi:hypothetical protein